MGIALAYRSALVPTDPWHYVQGALAFPDGTWRPSGLSRWGFLLPIIPFARIWGDATATYYVVPVLSTGVLAAVLYLLGTRYVSRSTGVLAAAFALGTPLVFVNLTRGYTDLTATTLIGLALLLATLAADAADEAREAGRSWGWRVPALLVACGFVTGWSFEVRETAIFAWPVIGWVLWRIGRPLRDPGLVRPTGPGVAGPRRAAVRSGLRRPVPQVPDHPGGGHLRVGGQLGRRLRRAVAVVVHDDPAPLDPGGLRRSGPPGLPGRRCGGGVVFRAQLGPDLGLGDADGRPALAPGRTARPRASLRAPGRRALLAVVHRPADAGRGGHDGRSSSAARGAPGGWGRQWRAACWPSGWSCRPCGSPPPIRGSRPTAATPWSSCVPTSPRRVRRAGGRPGLGRLGHPAGAPRLPDQPVRRPALGGGQLPLAQPAGPLPADLGCASTPSPGSTS